MNRPTPETTVAEARAWVEARALTKEATDCPTCDRPIKAYHRQIHQRMALDLVACYREHGRGKWFDLPATLEAHGRGTGNFSYLRFWGLVEPMPGRRHDGAKQNGEWKITLNGEWYIAEGLHVPQYARVFLGRFLGLTGDPVDISHAMGSPFNFDALMADSG